MDPSYFVCFFLSICQVMSFPADPIATVQLDATLPTDQQASALQNEAILDGNSALTSTTSANLPNPPLSATLSNAQAANPAGYIPPAANYAGSENPAATAQMTSQLNALLSQAGRLLGQIPGYQQGLQGYLQGAQGAANGAFGVGGAFGQIPNSIPDLQGYLQSAQRVGSGAFDAGTQGVGDAGLSGMFSQPLNFVSGLLSRAGSLGASGLSQGLRMGQGGASALMNAKQAELDYLRNVVRTAGGAVQSTLGNMANSADAYSRSLYK